MIYNIRFRPRAVKEYLDAITWYKSKSEKAVENFILSIEQTLKRIEKQPDYFRNSYKHFHEAKTAKYPYAIVYFIDEKNHLIIITTLFHQKRNPENKFRS